MKTKRTYKDSLFRHMFKNKRWLANLYKALSGIDVPPKDITLNTLRGVFMNDVKNDISFRVGDRLVILVEHQSTWNPNMPVRFLLYLARIYAREVSRELIYRSEVIKIPTPEFYVLYNGTKEIPLFQEQRLSDAFKEKGDALELKVKCFNINYSKDNPLMNRCYELKCYSIFVQQVREGVKKGETLFSAVKDAIRYCENHDLMADYFKQNESEVFDMVSFKWDENRAREIAVEEAEARGKALGEAQGEARGEARGRAIGEAQGEHKAIVRMVLALLKGHYPVSAVSSVTQLSPEEISQIAKDNGLAF